MLVFFWKYLCNESLALHEILRGGQLLSCELNPTSHGVSDSLAPSGGPQRPPPKKSRKYSFLTPCCYIAFLRFYIKGSHTKIWTETSKFERDFRISKFCEIEISGWFVACDPLIYQVKNVILQYGVRNESFLDFLGMGLWAPPPPPPHWALEPREVTLKS